MAGRGIVGALLLALSSLSVSANHCCSGNCNSHGEKPDEYCLEMHAKAREYPAFREALASYTRKKAKPVYAKENCNGNTPHFCQFGCDEERYYCFPDNPDFLEADFVALKISFNTPGASKPDIDSDEPPIFDVNLPLKDVLSANIEDIEAGGHMLCRIEVLWLSDTDLLPQLLRIKNARQWLDFKLRQNKTGDAFSVTHVAKDDGNKTFNPKVEAVEMMTDLNKLTLNTIECGDGYIIPIFICRKIGEKHDNNAEVIMPRTKKDIQLVRRKKEGCPLGDDELKLKRRTDEAVKLRMDSADKLKKDDLLGILETIEYTAKRAIEGLMKKKLFLLAVYIGDQLVAHSTFPGPITPEDKKAIYDSNDPSKFFKLKARLIMDKFCQDNEGGLKKLVIIVMYDGGTVRVVVDAAITPELAKHSTPPHPFVFMMMNIPRPKGKSTGVFIAICTNRTTIVMEVQSWIEQGNGMVTRFSPFNILQFGRKLETYIGAQKLAEALVTDDTCLPTATSLPATCTKPVKENIDRNTREKKPFQTLMPESCSRTADALDDNVTALYENEEALREIEEAGQVFSSNISLHVIGSYEATATRKALCIKKMFQKVVKIKAREAKQVNRRAEKKRKPIRAPSGNCYGPEPVDDNNKPRPNNPRRDDMLPGRGDTTEKRRPGSVGEWNGWDMKVYGRGRDRDDEWDFESGMGWGDGDGRSRAKRSKTSTSRTSGASSSSSSSSSRRGSSSGVSGSASHSGGSVGSFFAPSRSGSGSSSSPGGSSKMRPSSNIGRSGGQTGMSGTDTWRRMTGNPGEDDDTDYEYSGGMYYEDSDCYLEYMSMLENRYNEYSNYDMNGMIDGSMYDIGPRYREDVDLRPDFEDRPMVEISHYSTDEYVTLNAGACSAVLEKCATQTVLRTNCDTCK